MSSLTLKVSYVINLPSKWIICFFVSSISLPAIAISSAHLSHPLTLLSSLTSFDSITSNTRYPTLVCSSTISVPIIGSLSKISIELFSTAITPLVSTSLSISCNCSHLLIIVFASIVMSLRVMTTSCTFILISHIPICGFHSMLLLMLC